MDIFAEMLTDILALSLTGATLVVTVGAVAFAYFTYRMKDGIKVRGNFVYRSSIQSKNTYISSVSLYNEKDKSICITGIYLKLSPNIYLTIDDRREDHLKIGPFETIHLSYQPVVSYVHMMAKVDINTLLHPFNPYAQIILGTTEGKYVVKQHLGLWNPTSESLIKRTTVNVAPRRITIDDQAYGELLRYIVKLEISGKNYPFEIYDYDEIFAFTETCIATEADLKDMNSLVEFLENSQKNGTLPECKVATADGQRAYQQAMSLSGNKTYRVPSVPAYEVWLEELKVRIRSRRCLRRISWRFNYLLSLFKRYEGEDSL